MYPHVLQEYGLKLLKYQRRQKIAAIDVNSNFVWALIGSINALFPGVALHRDVCFENTSEDSLGGEGGRKQMIEIYALPH